MANEDKMWNDVDEIQDRKSFVRRVQLQQPENQAEVQTRWKILVKSYLAYSS
jgi:hypothetical protein